MPLNQLKNAVDKDTTRTKKDLHPQTISDLKQENRDLKELIKIIEKERDLLKKAIRRIERNDENLDV